jgi:serine/threonine-protein kinase
MSGSRDGPQRVRRIRALFDEAIELHGDARASLLEAAAQTEPELVDEVRALIRSEEAQSGLDAATVLEELDRSLRRILPDALAPGLAVGAYRVVAEIGAGGMGRVFRAERIDPTLKRDVAIKVIRRDMLSPKALDRFQDERAVLARLSHPGICQFIDAGTLADGSPYVVMEFLDGAVPITTYADRARLTVAARIALFRKVLSAVDYAHRNLVVHRDIKLSNVLVLPGGQPKLLDFGIAKSLDAGAGEVTATADRYFSIATAAPEQLTGAPITVGCDVYSLGSLFYELLSGAAPFDASTASIPALIEQIVHRVPGPMREAAAGLSEAALAARQSTRAALQRALSGELEEIVQRCLRKDARERYPSIDALDQDLQRLQEGLPISIRGGHAGYRLRKFIGRHRIASALAAALMLSLIAAAWIVTRQNIRIRAERDQATEALAILRDAFLSADPARMSGDTVTARQVMDSAFTTMEQRDSDSASFLDLMLTMAEVDLSLDNSERALKLTSRALSSHESNELDAAQRTHLRMLHASALSGNGKNDEAQALLDSIEPQDAEQRLQWLILNGRNLILLKEYARSEAMLREAIELTANAPPSDRSANRARRLLAENLAQQERPEQALSSLESTLAWQRRKLSEDHPYVLLVELLIANELRKLDRADEAIAIARRAVNQAESAYGEFSAIAARANLTLGNVLVARDDFAAAAVAMRRSRDALERILGRLHPNTVRAQFNLAVSLDEQAPEPAETTSELLRAVDDIRASMGARSTFAAMATLRLAQHHAESGDVARARALLSDQDLAAILDDGAPANLLEMAAEVRAAVTAAATTQRESGNP